VTDRAGSTADAAIRIDRERLIDDLQTLVRIPSVTGAEEVIADHAAGLLQELGLTVEVVRPDLAAHRADPAWPGEEMDRSSLPVVIGRAGPPGAAGPRLILSGHLDVVPAGDPATWTADPWAGDVRDGSLYGRGACEMKGGVASNRAPGPGLAEAGDHLR
jgi:acetylornithine deacetylase